MSKSVAGEITITSHFGISEYKWVIDNFCIRCKNVSQTFKSPVFSTFSFDTTYKWQLELFPNGYNKQCQNYVSLFLNLLTQNVSIKADVTCSVLDDTGKVISSTPFCEREYNKRSDGCGSWGY